MLVQSSQKKNPKIEDPTIKGFFKRNMMKKLRH